MRGNLPYTQAKENQQEPITTEIYEATRPLPVGLFRAVDFIDASWRFGSPCGSLPVPLRAAPIQIFLVDVKLRVNRLAMVLSARIVEPISLLQHAFNSPTGS